MNYIVTGFAEMLLFIQYVVVVAFFFCMLDCSVGCLNMYVRVYCFCSVFLMNVLHSCICFCSAQMSISFTENRRRNKIIYELPPPYYYYYPPPSLPPSSSSPLSLLFSSSSFSLLSF